MASCWESCYWHLIEKRFCFDKDIALYQEPITREEKNDNTFENMAFYDSVSVIAGRAIVTIDPLPEKEKVPVVHQPKRLTWQEQATSDIKNDSPTKSILSVVSEKVSDDDSMSSSESQVKEVTKKEPKEKVVVKKSVSFKNDIKNSEESLDNVTQNSNKLAQPDVNLNKKSLRERRMSKSLYLKIDYPKELPIIRQNSTPKFYLDSPEENQTESTLIKSPLTALQSPMVKSGEYSYDLYSVVQMEMEKAKSQAGKKKDTIKRGMPLVHRESSKMTQIKVKVKLRKTKSTLSSSNIPHSNYI